MYERVRSQLFRTLRGEVHVSTPLPASGDCAFLQDSAGAVLTGKASIANEIGETHVEDLSEEILVECCG